MQTRLKNHLAWIHTLKIMLVLIIISISKREGFAYNNITTPQDAISDDLLATFGEQTGHPFSMDRVMKAYNSLPGDMRSGISESDIQPTHKYVRFMPASEEQMWSIEKRSELNLYPYPLDCEITEGFVGINNPFLLNGLPQYWCIVDLQYPLDNMGCPYEIESELWYPKDNRSTNPAISFLVSSLLSSSTNNGFVGGTREATLYYLNGSIKYWDDTLLTTPISGIEVEVFDHANNSYSSLTDDNGVYYLSECYFDDVFRFRIKFSRHDFSFHYETNLTSIEYLSNWTQSSINLVFMGSNAKYAAIFQAAEHYYYSQTEVPTPPLNTLWTARLKIRFFPNDSDPDGAALGYFYRTGVSYYERPCIDIYGKYSNNASAESVELFSTTTHELAHAMHYSMDKNLFDSIENNVKESVATGIEYFFTLARYPTLIKNFCIGMYTAIIRDLCDGAKTVVCTLKYDTQLESIVDCYATYYDDVNSYYSLSETIEAVRTCVTFQQWNNRIYQLYHGPGEELYNAFDFWFEYGH